MRVDGDWSQAPGPEDGELVQRARAGDFEAFGELVARYEKKVYNLGLRYTGDPQEAEDLAQETFVRVFRALHRFRGEARFSTWLYRVATNVCLDALRRRRLRPEPVLDRPLATDEGELERELVSPEPEPATQLEAAERSALIRREIAAVREPYRSVLILRDLQDLSYEEVAAILGVSIGTVKSRLHRARELLRQRFETLELFASERVDRSKRARAAEGGESR
ncbi:MAG TPA: sigma-70 family RNA polymerase sigma factor [Bacillota bacterium]